ncbi:MAG: hypothetical protein NW215_00700 [Hyphomicrobiales bacterium]|nr:hypothetical protein [Hyphomicrobiales bacterium]
MAFESLDPYRAEILKLRTPGPDQRSFSQIANYLYDQFRLRTTPGTLSRYMKHLNASGGLRETTQPENAGIDTLILFAELLVEIKGRGDEQRAAIEAQASELRLLAETIAELQKTQVASKGTIPPELVRGIWLRAFALSGALVLATAGLVLALSL